MAKQQGVTVLHGTGEVQEWNLQGGVDQVAVLLVPAFLTSSFGFGFGKVSKTMAKMLKKKQNMCTFAPFCSSPAQYDCPHPLAPPTTTAFLPWMCMVAFQHNTNNFCGFTDLHRLTDQ